MSEADTIPSFDVTAAFESQLKTLCIKEFPCGFGSWRVPEVSSNTTVKSTIPTPHVVISHTDTSAQLETVEGLQELASKPPYNVDCSWSGEAKSLREIAVTEPNKLTDAFILKFFKSLRIVDKKVTEIDEGLLQFKNLKQLTLSANLISHVNSRRLPQGLEELELSANRIMDITSLCVSPPPLIHLGLGYNYISSIAGLMRPEYWSKLLSLDLSCNNLAHLHNTVNVLKTLPKLKNLVLQGNPLALAPGYRGLTIDSIRKLTILDDIRISADEKHYFKGLSKLKDIKFDEAQVTISVSTLRNVKKPEEIEDPDSQPEYPKIEHKYHVEFRFIREQPAAPQCQSPAPSIPTISLTSHFEDDGKAENAPSVEQEIEQGEDLFETVATESLPWAEETIELNYSARFSITNLAALRDFLKQGIEFSVVETRHSYVLEDPNAPTPGEGKSPHASAKSHRPDSKLRKTSSKEKMKDSNKGKEKGKEGKGKKGKQEEVELFELPRQRRNLGSCHVVLASLLDGEFEVVSDCECHGGEGTEDKSDKKEDDGKADGSEKKKGGKESSDKASKANLKAGASGKAPKGARGKSAQKPARAEHSKEDEQRKMKKIDESFDEEEAAPPPPLGLSVKLGLHSWKSAREATMGVAASHVDPTVQVQPCA